MEEVSAVDIFIGEKSPFSGYDANSARNKNGLSQGQAEVECIQGGNLLKRDASSSRSIPHEVKS
jgi:hypothetical protein